MYPLLFLFVQKFPHWHPTLFVSRSLFPESKGRPLPSQPICLLGLNQNSVLYHYFRYKCLSKCILTCTKIFIYSFDIRIKLQKTALPFIMNTHGAVFFFHLSQNLLQHSNHSNTLRSSVLIANSVNSIQTCYNL